MSDMLYKSLVFTVINHNLCENLVYSDDNTIHLMPNGNCPHCGVRLKANEIYFVKRQYIAVWIDPKNGEVTLEN